jgi:hypothetical protein
MRRARKLLVCFLVFVAAGLALVLRSASPAPAPRRSVHPWKNRRYVDTTGTAYWIYTAPGADHGDATDLVTVATQCTAEHLPDASRLAAAWGGPVAVALFAPAAHVQEAWAALARAAVCDGNFARTRFALVFPAANDAGLHEPALSDLHVDCGSVLLPGAAVAAGPAVNYVLDNTPYPNNLLRNVARGLAATPFTLVLDVDVLPYPASLCHDLAVLLAPHTHRRAVWVLPAFEVVGVCGGAMQSPRVLTVSGGDAQYNGTALPASLDKVALAGLWAAGAVRPFYGGLCPHCHAPTQYARWWAAAAAPYPVPYYGAGMMLMK